MHRDTAQLGALSSAAILAYRTLRDHPDLNTPAQIASGPYSVDQIDEQEIARGLRELEAALLAVQSFGGWSLLER